MVGAFFATVSFSILFNTGKTKFYQQDLQALVGWAVYLLALHLLGNAVTATFSLLLAVGLLSVKMAVIFKAPATIFRVLGVIPIVPV